MTRHISPTLTVFCAAGTAATGSIRSRRPVLGKPPRCPKGERLAFGRETPLCSFMIGP
jgi:hypothetical protein